MFFLEKNTKLGSSLQFWVAQDPIYSIQGTTLTEGSHSSEPFFTQVNHLISSNRFSKQVMNPADFPTLKIWDQSDH